MLNWSVFVYCLSMLPRRSILGLWKLFVHAKNNFIQRQFLPVLFWICTKDACSFRQKEVFPRMRAACNINYHFHYALTISCLMWSLTVINPGITFHYLIEIWISRKYILPMLFCVISSFSIKNIPNDPTLRYFLGNLVLISIVLYMWERISFVFLQGTFLNIFMLFF